MRKTEVRRSQFPKSKVHLRGFTLIEMLVVFTLIALLLSIAVPRYLNSVDSSRAKVREQNIATLRDALDKFKADQGHYPANLGELVTKQYLRRIPLDPVSGTTDWVTVKDTTSSGGGVYDVTAPEPSSIVPSQAPSSSPSVSTTSP